MYDALESVTMLWHPRNYCDIIIIIIINNFAILAALAEVCALPSAMLVNECALMLILW